MLGLDCLIIMLQTQGLYHLLPQNSQHINLPFSSQMASLLSSHHIHSKEAEEKERDREDNTISLQELFQDMS